MILRALIVSLLFIGAFTQDAAAADNDAARTVRLEVLPDGLALVKVTVNGSGPHLFLLDTGGASTVLSDSLARQLGLAQAGTHRIDTMSGTRTVGITHIDELRLGGETFTGVEVLWMDLANLRTHDSRIQGIIGQDLLRTRSFLIDYESRRLTFDPTSPIDGPRLPLDWSDGRPLVRVVGHHTGRSGSGGSGRGGRAGACHTSAALRFVVDSGGTHVILFDHSPAAQPLLEALRDNAAVTMTMTNHGGSRPVLTATVDKLELGDGKALRGVMAALVPMDPEQGRIEDGLLPASLFRAIYFDNRAGQVVLKGR